jgi:hypothetical protein
MVPAGFKDSWVLGGGSLSYYARDGYANYLL